MHKKYGVTTIMPYLIFFYVNEYLIEQKAH